MKLQEGRVALDPSPSGYLEIAVDSVTSGRRLEDIELKRRIQVKRFPTARFDVTQVDGGLEGLRVSGDLTWRDVTAQVTAEVDAGVQDGLLHVEGTLKMDVRDFGLEPPKVLGLQVHPTIEITARLQGKQVAG